MRPENVIAAWAEPAYGPGWANSPVWYLVRSGAGNLRLRCLQPDEQTDEVMTLYSVSSATHMAMTRAVERGFRTKKKPA